VLYDLPGTDRELPEGVAPKGTLPSGARQGRNDFGKTGYGGPCPPPGPAHRYYFRLYALDTELRLEAGVTRARLDRSMRGHILAHAELMSRYRREA
jgi:Raf kinase inhibitor-like YbhB/YbcL family protein